MNHRWKNYQLTFRRSSRSRCQPISYFELDACTEISEMSTDNSSTCGSVTGSDMNEVVVEKVVTVKKGRRSKSKSVNAEVIDVEKGDVPTVVEDEDEKKSLDAVRRLLLEDSSKAIQEVVPVKKKRPVVE